jgi:SAM-dependent methyltransferase
MNEGTKQSNHYTRLQRFVEERLREDIYPEIPMDAHILITRLMIERLNRFIPVEGKKILDCGCGQGLALEEFSKLGAYPTGTTFGEDYRICKSKGYVVYEMDQSFLDFAPSTFDIIWCRHALEHSLFPMFTLRGFHEVLKPEGLLYVEVPAPNTDAKHEMNLNHYSCFTKNAWISLFLRSKFKIVDHQDIPLKIENGGDDLYHSFMLLKA